MQYNGLVIDREAREIMHLVASVCPSICVRCVSVISGRLRIIVFVIVK